MNDIIRNSHAEVVEAQKIAKYFNLFITIGWYLDNNNKKQPMKRVSADNTEKIYYLVGKGYTLNKIKKEYKDLPLEWIMELIK